MSSKTPKVIINIGIPGAGKSTWTEQFIKENPSYIRVNRDDLRMSFRKETVCDGKSEDIITDAINETIIATLKRGRNVVVDNTNVKLTYINKIINLVKYSADIEFKLFDVPVDVCIERDSKRINPVGENVIRSMFDSLTTLKENFKFEPITKIKDRPMPLVNIDGVDGLIDAVIFDVDGTLTQGPKDRSPYDWMSVDNDLPNKIVIEQIEFHRNKGRHIILCSGRDSVCRDLTIEWCKTHGVYFDELFMRTKNDNRKDSEIKKDLYEQKIKPKYNVICVFDDRLQVLTTWYKLGLFTMNVNQGNLSF
jgi:predicted kinase